MSNVVWINSESAWRRAARSMLLRRMSMAERSFEYELSRLFADAPAMPDADLFALRVDERLRRGWTFRRVLIGGLGVVGGVIGGAQLLGGGVVDRFGETTVASGRLLTGKVIDLIEDA